MDDQTVNKPDDTAAGQPGDGGVGDVPAPQGATSSPVSPVSSPPSESPPAQTGTTSTPTEGTGISPVSDVPSQPAVSDMAEPVAPPAVAPGTDENLAAEVKKPLKEGEKKEEVSTSVPPVSDSVAPQGATPAQVQGSEKQTSATPIPQQPAPTEPQQPAPAESQQVVQEPAGSTATPSADTDDLAKTHEPIIVLPDRLEMGQNVTVKVRVGMVPHVMDASHYIQSIELFGNDKSLGKVELNPKDNPNPEAEFQVPLQAGLTLKAVIYCNVHGKWESTRSV
jgi:superoxide reductase